MMTRRTLGIGVLVMVWCGSVTGLHAQSPTVETISAQHIVEEWEKTLRGARNSVAEMEISVITPQWQRSMRIKSWDDRERKRSFIKIVSPPKEAGRKFLKLNYELWMFMPDLEQTVRIPPSLMLESWMGSDFSNDDLVKESSLVADYTPDLLPGDVQIDGEVAHKVQLTPKPGAPVVWGKIVVWARKKDLMPLKEDYFDERGRLVKAMTLTDVALMDGQSYPTLWVMTPVTKPGRRTEIRTHTIRFNTPIPDEVFSMSHLKRSR